MRGGRPFEVINDHETGVSRVVEGQDPLSLLKAAESGLNALCLARLLYDTQKPANAQREKARRILEKLVAEGDAKITSQKPGKPSVYQAMSRDLVLWQGRWVAVHILRDGQRRPWRAVPLTEGRGQPVRRN